MSTGSLFASIKNFAERTRRLASNPESWIYKRVIQKLCYGRIKRYVSRDKRKMTNFAFPNILPFMPNGKFVSYVSRTQESEKPFVIKDLLEYLDELVAEIQGPGPITSSQGFLPFFLPPQLIPRIRTLIVVPFLLVLLAGGIDLASRLTAGC